MRIKIQKTSMAINCNSSMLCAMLTIEYTIFSLTCLLYYVCMCICAFPYIPLIFCSVLTPYYNEEVLFTMDSLEKPNEDGVSILFYLQKIYPG